MSRIPRSQSRRVARVVAGALLLGATGLLASVPAAGQEAPPEDSFDTEVPKEAVLLQYGWWNKAQQSPAGGAPVPAPPGAPPDGIFIAYEPTAGPAPTPAAPITGIITTAPPQAPKPLGPDAFGAVRYSVPQGAEAILTLKFTLTTASQPGGVNPDSGDLFACPVTSAWDPVQNGRYEAAPKYECPNGVKAEFSGDTVVFNLSAALAPTGTFDLALVPSGAKPFKLSMPAPDSSSMMLTSVPESEVSGSEEAFDPSMLEDPAASFDESFDTGESFGSEAFGATGDEFGFGDFSEGTFTTTAGRAGTRTRTPGAGGEVGVPAAVRNPFRADASRSERLMAVALLLAMATGLWWIGGQPVRGPRLLGSLGAGIPVPATGVKTGGIGRFARVRATERPPRLF